MRAPPVRSLALRSALLCAVGFTMAAAPVKAGEGTGLPSIAEREVQRRQGMVQAAEGQLAEGLLLMGKDQPGEAATTFLSAYRSIPETPSTAALRGRLRDAFADAACGEAHQLLAKAEYARAGEMLDTVLSADVHPKHPGATKLKAQAADPDRYPPALTPDHIQAAEKVKELLIKAGSAVDLGDYDLALQLYADVLRLDRYNVAARRGMDLANHHKSAYYDAARDQQRAKMLSDVSKHWEAAVPPASSITGLFTGDTPTVAQDARQALQKKLRSIVIPKAEFAGATLEEVTEFLRVTSKNADPEGRGVSFILNVDAEAKARTLALSINEVPLEELIRYVTEMSGTSSKIDANAVVIESITARATSMITKQYRVPPDFIQSSEDTGAAAPAADPFAPAAVTSSGGLKLRRLGAKEFLVSRGVGFPDGASASFSPSTSTLIVRNSMDNLNLVDMLVEQAMGATTKQVKITVRVVDVSQENFAEFGMDIGLGGFNLPGSERVFGSGGQPGGSTSSVLPTITSGNRSSGPILGAPGVTELIRQNTDTPAIDSKSPSAFRLFGVTSDPSFDVQIRALANKRGADILAMPSVITKSGQKASVRVVREFPYPSEFDPPQVPQEVGTIRQGNVRISTPNNSGPVIPATPTAFEKKELGTILDVEPVVGPDGRTVELSVVPIVSDFEGFIDYGDDISNRIDSLTSTFLLIEGTRYTQPNDILQPIFRTQTANTAVTIYDGSTVVIGGVVEERSIEMDDKVPVVGNIPLLGRAFQSKVRQTRKRCVMFFVTVDIIDASGQKVNQPNMAPAIEGAQ